MDKNRLRAFAASARQELIQRVTDRAAIYGIDEKRCAAGALAPSESYQKIDGAPLTREEARQRDALLAAVAARGFAQAMEEAAYTWFNRLAALRYMQAHDLLPVRVSVLPDAPGRLPQIVAEAQQVDVGLPPELVLALLEHSRTDALYKLQLIRLCNLLSESLPRVFEPIGDYTELLFPDGLLRPDSVLGMMSALPPDSWDDIETVGWLYQYYNAQLKDETFELLRKNVKITRERIGPATQLFTPEWIVRYMVENSVGRLWLEGHPDAALREKWRYYLDEAEQEPQTAAQLASLRRDAAALRPEEIAVLDPCMGSGHILVAAFDLLMHVYRAQGYIDRDAARLIVERNLYGLDIDERAAQLAYFAVMMKACEYDRRFLRRGVAPNVMPVAESDPRDEALLSRFGELEDAARRVWSAFLDAKEYGSLLSVDATLQELDALAQRANELAQADDLLGHAAAGALLPLIRQAKLLARRYDAVVTNPPYMGSSNMDEKLSRFVKEHYPDGKSDLFAAFIERCGEMTRTNGKIGLVTMNSWMFLSSFENLRRRMLSGYQIETINHLGMEAFDGIIGKVVQTVAFTLANHQPVDSYQGKAVRLTDFYDARRWQKETEFFNTQNHFVYRQDNFFKIPGSPVAYWVSEDFISTFTKGISIDSISLYTGSQNITANNDKYLRFIWEVSSDHAGEKKKWVFYIKGGLYRKWYGNIELFVDWSDEAREFYRTNPTSNLLAEEYWFKEGITYTELTSAENSFRYVPPVAVFDKKGPCIVDVRNLYYCLGFFNTRVAVRYFQLLNPTITLQVKDVKNTPVIIDAEKIPQVESLVKENVSMSHIDWDSFETSWDFKRHPLI